MKIPQTSSELKGHLQDQLSLIARSCSYFDKGECAESKRIAQGLRILLHDTRSSKSLLGQLGKKQLLFVDTARAAHPMNLIGTTGLCVLVMSPPPTRYLAAACTPFEQTHWMLPFDAWWSETVISVPSESYQISRSALVLARADQDGGAHVDQTLEEWYYRASRENIGGMTASDGADLGSYVDASIRQIAYELDRTLAYSWPEIPQDLSGDDLVRLEHESFSFNGGPTLQRTLRIPRNLCPCRSGLAYSQCHKRAAPVARRPKPYATRPTKLCNFDWKKCAISIGVDMLSVPGLIPLPLQ